VHVPSAGSSHSNAGAACTAPLPLSGEDQARADLYALLARLLLAPPDAALLAGLATADPIHAEHAAALETAWQKLTLAAAVTEADAVADEFNALFVSVGTPRLNPYESRYLSGFLNDAPLASLRADLAELGLARASGVGDFEDHLGAICETMRVLIAGGPGIARQPVLRQKWFFDRHIAPWHERCLLDIASEGESSFYRLVAGFALAFFAIEAEAFAFEESIDG
jgi:TorA maturation chaperone TorD